MERAAKTLVESGQLYHQLLCLSGCSRNPSRLVLCFFPPSIRSNILKPKELRSRGVKRQVFQGTAVGVRIPLALTVVSVTEM